MVGIASPRFEVYTSVPGAGINFGSGAAFVVEMLADRTCAAPGAATAGLAVWASALKVLEECGAITQAARAKRRQKIPVMMRDDGGRKRSSARVSLSSDTSRAGWRSLVTCGLIRLTVPVPVTNRGSVILRCSGACTRLRGRDAASLY